MFDEDYFIRSAQKLIDEGNRIKKDLSPENFQGFQEELVSFGDQIEKRIIDERLIKIGSRLKELDYSVSPMRVLLDLKFNWFYLLNWSKKGKFYYYLDESTLLLNSIILMMKA